MKHVTPAPAIRLSINKEVGRALGIAKRRYPTLSDAEILKLGLSKIVTEAEEVKFRKEADEIMASSSYSVGYDYLSDPAEDIYTEDMGTKVDFFLSKSSLYGVYIVRFPYLDSTKFKIRPVIAMSNQYGKHGVVAVVPISSKLLTESVDVTINNWSHAGLVKPSVARVHRLTTVLQARLTIQLGSISPDDIKQLKTSIRKFLEL